jgi:hypothetical protein
MTNVQDLILSSIGCGPARSVHARGHSIVCERVCRLHHLSSQAVWYQGAYYLSASQHDTMVNSTLVCLCCHLHPVFTGSVQSQVICEKQGLKITCPNAGDVVTILAATYAVGSSTLCNGPVSPPASCSQLNVTKKVADYCNSAGCYMFVTNSLFGADPCRRTPKALNVSYTCGELRNQTYHGIYVV